MPPLTCLIAFWMKGEFTVPRVLVLAMVTIWGLRLATHIYNRSRGHDEDERYKFMRESFKKRGHALLNSYLRIYLMQSLWVLIITCPVVLIICSSERNRLALLVGGSCLAVWIFMGSYRRLSAETISQCRGKQRTYDEKRFVELYTTPELFWGGNTVVGGVYNGSERPRWLANFFWSFFPYFQFVLCYRRPTCRKDVSKF